LQIANSIAANCTELQKKPGSGNQYSMITPGMVRYATFFSQYRDILPVSRAAAPAQCTPTQHIEGHQHRLAEFSCHKINYIENNKLENYRTLNQA